MIRKERIDRRKFLRNSTMGVIGLGMLENPRGLDPQMKAEKESLKIKEYRTLGRTGFKASDVGYGCVDLQDKSLLVAALDAGINYIDTAEGYMRGNTERIVGAAIKGRNRKSIFITTKLELRPGTTKVKLKDRARECLERLQTDYVDCLMIHGCESVDQVKNEAFHTAFSELKSEGKVRFAGLSNHGSQYGDDPRLSSMEDVVKTAAGDGRFEVALIAYNFLQKDMGERILKTCKEKDIGATIMKTNPVLEYTEFRDYSKELEESGKEVPEWLVEILVLYKQRVDQSAAFKKKYNLSSFDHIRDAANRFVLSNPIVSSICFTVKNFSQLEAYIALSGTRLDTGEKKMLADYRTTLGHFYCRHACGLCEPQCPHHVPVNTIMRYDHYFRAQGREKYAMQEYAKLSGIKADRCWGCPGYCEIACPSNIPVQGLLALAHQNLTLV